MNFDEIKPEITNLLHLAIIAQIQAWEACNNLEAALETSLVPDSPEFSVLHLGIGDVVAELASEPDKSIPETLAGVDADGLIEALRAYQEERSTVHAE